MSSCCSFRCLFFVSFISVFYLLYSGFQFQSETSGIYHHKTYEPTENSLKQHIAPHWWKDAKLGIFVHWGLYSVPGFAPTQFMFSDRASIENYTWFKFHPYSEWYMNTHRIKGSPSSEFHRKHFGKLSYMDAFVPRFNKGIQDWNPSAWANLFKNAGARYVVLTSKHHDGFTLWPSDVKNPHRTEEHTRLDRDIVGELGQSVRHVGMRYGLYYSGGLDWSFPGTVDGHCKACHYRPRKPQDPEEYSNYATSHLWELMEKYKPCILWNDINYPSYKKEERLFEIFAHFYSKVCPGHGVVNNRWKLEGNWKGDFETPEYKIMENVNYTAWETNRGIGFSFGYNRNEGEKETLGAKDLIVMFIDIVSKGGNLLLDVGPMPNGSLSWIQEQRLKDLGGWMEINSEAIHGTRPFLPEGAIPSGNFRYTRNKDYMGLYVFVLDWHKRNVEDKIIDIPMNIKGFVIIEQFVSKYHIKEVHQIQNGRETVVHGIHFPDQGSAKKLPLVFRITTPKPLRKVITITGF